MQMTKKAFAASPGDADFDGIHSGYPAKYLPEAGLTYAGVDFDFPQYRETGNDNVLAMGQTIMPPAGRYSSIHLLAAAETAIATGNITTTYTDNTTTTAPVVDYNRSTIFQTISWVDSTKEISSIKLPNDTRLHIFAMSLVPATGSGLALEVQHARSTNSWMEGTNKTQIFSVKVNNVGDDWIMANNSVKVTIEASGIETVVPGIINRLRPGGQAAVQVGVTNSEGTVPGTIGEATVRIIGQGVNTSSTFNATLGIPAYDATYESIYSHESPSWYNNGKFGIFIHWGVYSVPGWGNI
ncbi:putative glycoside hydrolase, family 29, glycoside hydrolase superfamily [Septoria linicola]|nr:putative glycoside hydrolase, family 29, glycoside hydrolase superfamily [Septoria linicola]